MALKLNAVIENWTINEYYTDLNFFLKVFNELCIIMDLVNNIPSSLRKKMLNASHNGHQGIVETKQLLRLKMWYHYNVVLLAAIDEYSRFVEFEITKSTSMKSAIPKLDKAFLSIGIPLGKVTMVHLLIVAILINMQNI